MLTIDYPENGKVSLDVPYSYWLEKCTKKYLMHITDVTSFVINKSLRKQDFIWELADLVENKLNLLISRLPLYEIGLLKRLMELPQGEGLTIYHNSNSRDLIIAELCMVLVHMGPAESGEWTLFLSTEKLRGTILRAIDSVSAIDDSVKRTMEEFDIVAEGLLNTVGPMPESEFHEFIRRRFPEAEDSDDKIFLYLYLMSNTAFGQLSVNVKDDYATNYLVPRMVCEEDIDRVLDRCLSRSDLEPDYDSITDEQLRALGERPYVRPTNVQGEKVWRFFTDKMDMTPDQADRLYTELWTKVQVDERPGGVISWLSGRIKLKSFEQLQDFMQIFMDFSNSIPKWALKGHSSDEIAKRQQTSRRPLTDMPFSFGSSQKTGRNDLCPCGSGKKYKHCCGK